MSSKKNKYGTPNSALENMLLADNEEADKDLIKNARKRFVHTSESWDEIRKESIEDQKFYSGNQYDAAAVRASRARGGAPQIQINMLPQFVQQVENNIRQQNIGLNVHATDEQGSEETAKVMQGIIRHIEHISNAKQAYLWAAGSHGALVPGFGFIKIETDFTTNDPNSASMFDQEIYIRGIKDPMKILPDFMAIMPDFSDAQFWFEFEDMDKDDYKEKYSKSKLSAPTFGDWSTVGSAIGSRWIRNNVITIAKYWYKETEIRHFAAFEDGTTGFLDDYGVEINDKGEMEVVDAKTHATFPTVSLSDDEKAQWLQDQYDAHVATGANPDEFPITDLDAPQTRQADILKTREVVSNTVSWITTNGVEILDRGDWHDSEFPFVAVVGVDEVIDGERQIHGIIHYSKDPQKMYNFITSQIVRKVDASNKSAWIAAAESIPEPQRKRWETSNQENHAVLYYNAFDDENKPLPPPQRGDAIEPAVQGLLAAGNKFNQDIKGTVGIFEAGIGQGIGDRQSGSAIQTLAQNGEITNFHFSDNLVLSMKRLGCLIIRLIPKIYDTPRTVRIVGLDDDYELVKINQIFSEDGVQKKHDIANAASYDVVVDTGPTFASKKAEQSESMLKFGAVEPQLMPIIADLLAGNMDWDVSGTIKDRIQQWQAAQFPWMHQDGTNNPITSLPPQAKIAFQQLTQQLNVANQHVATLSKAYQDQKYINDTGAVSHQAKERQLIIKSMTELQLQKNKLIADNAIATDKIVLDRVKAELKHINDKQQLHLNGLKLQDQATNSTDNELYNSLQMMIDQGNDKQ